MNMEHKFEININFGEVKFTCPDLIEAAKILTGATSRKLKVEGKDIGKSLTKTIAEPLTEAAGKTDPSELSDTIMAETPKTTKHLHYGLQADGVSTYTKWDDMCKALDHARETQGPAKVKEVLTAYSDNGEYGGVQPANWDKVIKACTVQDEAAKSYTIEQMRALARKVQTEKGKETLHSIFQEFDKVKLSQFEAADYPKLYDRLLQEVQ